MNNCEVTTKRKKQPLALRLEATITDPQDHVVHTCRFNWNELNERWAFTWRMEDVLSQGFRVQIQKVDPKAERLARRFQLQDRRS